MLTAPGGIEILYMYDSIYLVFEGIETGYQLSRRLAIDASKSFDDAHKEIFATEAAHFRIIVEVESDACVRHEVSFDFVQDRICQIGSVRDSSEVS